MSYFLKGYCKKINQYFYFNLVKEGSVYKVENMTHMKEEDAKKVTSTVSQPQFVTRDHLLPCSKCGSRVIAGCSCATKTQCSRGVYKFQCAYCKNMEIDYSTPIVAGKGEIVLGQNEVIDLSKLVGSTAKLDEVWVAGGWDPAKIGPSIDVDLSIVMLGDGVYDKIYFGNKVDSAGSITHYGDNLTGERGYVSGLNNDDDEMIRLKLKMVPDKFKALYFVINIFNCKERLQTFNRIKNNFVRMYTTEKPLLRYNVGENNGRATALVVASLVRNGQDWQFKAIGDYNKCESIDELVNYCRTKFYKGQ